jgi:hypothetical protein
MSEEKKEKQIQFVLITHEWLDRWLPILNETELKVYLRLAYHYNVKDKISFPGQEKMAEAIGVKKYQTVGHAASKLEELGLIEIIKKGPQKGQKGYSHNKYRMLHVDDKGYHRAERQRSSVKEVMEERMNKLHFLSSLFIKYNKPETMLKEAFKYSPEFKSAYYSQGWDRKEDFNLFEALSIFLISGLPHKYGDIGKEFENQAMNVFKEFMEQDSDKISNLKQEMIENWDRVLEDYQYCGEYIKEKYPEFIPVFKEAFDLKAKKVNNWSKEIESIIADHPDIEAINSYFEYGIFKELSEKHDIASKEISIFVKEIALEQGKIGFIRDLENYIYEAELPDLEVFLDEDERKYLELEEEDFSNEERRNHKATIEKIKTVRLKAIDELIDSAAYALADADCKGQIRKSGGGGFKPKIRHMIRSGSWYKHETKSGCDPPEKNLEDMLKYITFLINDNTLPNREYEHFKGDEYNPNWEKMPWEIMGQPYEDALVPIPPVSLEEVRERYENHKKKILSSQEV